MNSVLSCKIYYHSVSHCRGQKKSFQHIKKLLIGNFTSHQITSNAVKIFILHVKAIENFNISILIKRQIHIKVLLKTWSVVLLRIHIQLNIKVKLQFMLHKKPVGGFKILIKFLNRIPRINNFGVFFIAIHFEKPLCGFFNIIRILF